MKPLPLGIVNSSVVQRVIQNIEGFVKEGQVGEAATLAISCLSSSDNDSVGREHSFGLVWFFRFKQWSKQSHSFRSTQVQNRLGEGWCSGLVLTQLHLH